MRTELHPPPGASAWPVDLQGAGLLAPTLQPEPFPIRPILPSPCTQACPAGVQVKAYVSLIAEERFAEALEVIRRRCPLPGICGRICSHPCELACRRRGADEPIAIRALKRFVADLERELPRPEPPPGLQHRQRVAVIGSGPAGLTAAYDLRLAGYPVTVFEAEGEPGGMLRYGITAYRLPREILDQEIQVLERAGVEIRTGVRLGTNLDLAGLPDQGFAATVLALGAQVGRPLGAPGEDGAPEVEDALAFLRRVNDGDRSRAGRRVLVIGGGSTAVEAARSARRLGAESVEILYRRSKEELLAGPEEVEAAQAEGVRFQFLVSPVRALADGGHLEALECARVGLGEPDASGRRRPMVIPGTEFRLEADHVLAAVGQEVDLGFLPSKLRTRCTEDGRVMVDPATSLTRLSTVFAAGDMVTGPSTVIEAIAAGHRAAESVRHLLEEGRPGVREERPERRAAPEYELPDVPPLEAMRIHPAMRRPRAGGDFTEVEQVFNRRDAVAEARRCMRCGPCGECRACAPSCGRRHLVMRTAAGAAGATVLLRAPAGVALGLPADPPTPAWLLPRARPVPLHEQERSPGTEVEILPVRALLHSDLCRGCGSCADACPFHAIGLEPIGGQRSRARLQPALCRGCNLCSAVCPTAAVTPSAFTPEWWGGRLQEVAKGPAVLACQRRAGALEPILQRPGSRVRVIRFRCVGQVDAGMLLDLLQRGASRVLVAGCEPDRCRFGCGATLARDQVKVARGMLRQMGGDPDRIDTDWSPSRAHDRLEGPLHRFLEGKETLAVRPAAG